MTKKTIYKPKNDDEFLEQLSFIRFVSGFRYGIVETRWPKMRKAFYNFSVKKLSTATSKDVNKIMEADGMIRNTKKITDILENAKICRELAKSNGSVLNWISSIKKELTKEPLLAPSLKEEFQRFKGIGEMTSGWLESLHMAKGKSISYNVP